VTSAPWRIEDGRYDLFVALQVFEHPGDARNAAFGEVRRVARHAIVSVPIDWQMEDPRNCHLRISNERALSWFLPLRPARALVGNPGPRKRLIYVFREPQGPMRSASTRFEWTSTSEVRPRLTPSRVRTYHSPAPTG
jgi:hypothetical protein